MLALQVIAAVGERFEQVRHRRVLHRFGGAVRHQILLADISDVARFRILREQVVKGLLLGWPHFLRDCLIPLLAIGEDWIDVEDHAAKVEQAVADHVADREAGVDDRRRFGLARETSGVAIVDLVPGSRSRVPVVARQAKAGAWQGPALGLEGAAHRPGPSRIAKRRGRKEPSRRGAGVVERGGLENR